jgi:hypothetical protein
MLALVIIQGSYVQSEVGDSHLTYIETNSAQAATSQAAFTINQIVWTFQKT